MTVRRLVLDASALVELLRASDLGDRVAAELRGVTAAAPCHLDAEVLSALGRLVRADLASPATVARALGLLQRLPVTRVPLPPLLPRAWELRDNVAVRDGLYVACAEAVGAGLLTLNARLAPSAPVDVTVVA